MNITIIGTGYVGLVNGACMAANGANVTCIDNNEEKINKLKEGVIPIYEQALEPMVRFAAKRGNLKFTTDFSSIDSSELIFICVGTPEKDDGSADLAYVFDVTKKIIESVHYDHECVVVVKSTVPVGTTDKIRDVINSVLGENHGIHVAFNPEFLKEGYAVTDCTKPDRIVLGLYNQDTTSFEYKTLYQLYGKIMACKDKIVVTDVRSAEMVKYASNAMLATRISFMNEIANLCEVVGANVEDVSKCVGLDKRIGPHFLKAGCGYGGSCFPKDIKALVNTASENGQCMYILSAVECVNECQKDVPYEKYVKMFGSNRADRVCVLGLAFKPGTDDMREAPSINLINALLDDGTDVVACDPVATENAKAIFGSRIEYETDPYKAVKDADAVILVTEWDDFKYMDVSKVKDLMRGNVFIDGRGIFKRSGMLELGFRFDRIG